MEKKDIQRMEREILTMISTLKSLNLTTRNKINELIRSGRGLSEMNSLTFGAEELRNAQEDFDGLKIFPKTEEQLENLRSVIEETMKEARDLDKLVNEFEEKFLKYNVPRLHESESLEDYAESLRGFMKIWQEEAKKGREKGEKSLIEWLQQLDRFADEERKATFEEMKAVAIDLGTKISHCLSEAFLLMSLSSNEEEIKQNLDYFSDILECLSVEGNSNIINTFVYVMDFAERAMRLRELQRSGMDHVRSRLKEKGIFHLIIREVLRLEVAFSCPDLPMMLTNEVFLAMGSHLREVFEKKLIRIGLIVDELKKETRLYFRDEEVKKVSFLLETMDLGVKAIWSRLELKPEADDQSDN
ncbi:hypothetical protein L484_015644 [Morus notabilis]|uniref:Uncharacterized protein n=1 Tax=Morus notabilis TaxID=981085 RepID=W9QY42_9ROSA|nr:hypothetical protein L484_015644 [Morus notabilis]